MHAFPSLTVERVGDVLVSQIPTTRPRPLLDSRGSDRVVSQRGASDPHRVDNCRGW